MTQVTNKVLLLFGIVSLLWLGCGGGSEDPLDLSLKTEISLLNAEDAAPLQKPKQWEIVKVVQGEEVKASLSDKADNWNPFNHPGNNLHAKMSYQLLDGDEELLQGNCIIKIQGRSSYSGQREIEWSFGDEDTAPILPNWNSRQRFKTDQAIGDMNISASLYQGGGLELRYKIRSQWGKYESRTYKETLFGLEFSDFIDQDHFGYSFGGTFKNGDRYSLTKGSQDALEAFAAEFSKEQSGVMEKDPAPLKITCYVGKGFKWSGDRLNSLGFKMYKFILAFKSHTEALEAHAKSPLNPIFEQPEIVVDPSIKDANEFFWVLEYGNPVAG